MRPDMTMTSRDWQAEEDARRLMQANEVKSDPDRMKRAKDAAKVQAERMEEEAKNMRKAARRVFVGGSSSGMSIPAELRADGWTE